MGQFSIYDFFEVTLIDSEELSIFSVNPSWLHTIEFFDPIWPWVFLRLPLSFLKTHKKKPGVGAARALCSTFFPQSSRESTKTSSADCGERARDISAGFCTTGTQSECPGGFKSEGQDGVFDSNETLAISETSLLSICSFIELILLTQNLACQAPPLISIPSYL